MLYLGLAAILLFTLLLSLTVLRMLDNRPSPNAEMLAELLAALERPAPPDRERSRAAPRPSKARHA
ncbi:MAG: hypothetical protein H0S80_14300 [Desulfovibrionaceae bacterium]|nr:hypothetical protein [Desulfovibrionaceae bacterium]